MKRYLLTFVLLSLVPTVLKADTTTTNFLTNPGAETGSISGWTVGGTSNPGVDNGSFDGFAPHTGDYDFFGNNGPSGTLSQTFSAITQGVTSSSIDAGDVTANLSFWEQGLNQGTPSDDAAVTLFFLDGSSNVIGSVSSGEVDSHNGSWENFAGNYLLPAGTTSIEYQMDFTRHSGSDLDAFVDDNSLTLTTAAGTTGPSPVPEPSTMLLMGTGLLGAMGTMRRRLRA